MNSRRLIEVLISPGATTYHISLMLSGDLVAPQQNGMLDFRLRSRTSFLALWPDVGYYPDSDQTKYKSAWS
jgi:hypothetical protein